MTRARARRVLDSRSKQIPLIFKASRKWLRRFFHTRYTSARIGNSWQSLGACTKFLAAECGDTTPAGTVEHGVRRPVDGYLHKKEPGVFGLPRKDFRVTSRRRTFSFPRRGRIFLIWNDFPIFSTWVSWEKDQGLWNPLGFPRPKVPPVQITFVLARDWTPTPNPTGEDRWACPISPTRPWRTVQKCNHMITYYTPTSRNLKNTKNAFMQQQPKLGNNKQSRWDNHVTRKISFVYLYCLFILCVVLFLHCLALGFGSFSELYIFGNLSAGGKARL